MVSNMKFDDAVLSSYLVKKLQPLTEADPNLLARYVTALLKNNKPKKELESLCIEKLFDFLGDDSKSFVQNLFHAFEKGTIPKLNDDCGIKVAEVASTISVNAAARMTGEATCNGGVTDGRRCSQMEKPPEADNVVSGNLEEEGSDDEDDDRNHKHRRQGSTYHSLNRVKNIQVFSPKEHDKSDINGGPPAYDGSIPAAEILKGLSVFNTERNGASKIVPHCDQAYISPSRYIRENNLHGFSTNLRGNGLGSRFGHQNNLSRGVPGHGRGAPPIAHGQKFALNGLDFNLPLLSLGPTFNPLPGIATSSRLNASQSSWAGIGQFPGVRTGPHDQLFPFNQAMQNDVGSTVGCSRCPDFEERGYCLRGDLCPMEHGANRIVVKDFQSLSKLNLPLVIPSGLDMTLSSSAIFTSSFTSNLSNPILFTRDINLPMMDEPIFLKGTLTDDDFPEPDSYDPDQPLFNKEQPSALASGIKRLSSFRKDLEDNEGVLKRHREDSPDEGRFERYSSSVMPLGLTQGWYVRHSSHDINNADSNPRHTADAVEAERELFVESYEPEDVLEKHLKEEEESLVKSASMKAGISSAPQREVGRYSAGLKSRNRWIAGAEGDRAHRTLYVGCIPKINNKKELLKVHFQKFGVLKDIRIPSQGDRAFIQFSRREEAEAALKSPEAVMGNRFVRLYWAKRDNVPFSSTDSDLAAPSTTGHCLNVEFKPEVSQGLLTEASLTKANRTVSMSAPSEPNWLTTVGKSIVPSFLTMASASSLKKQQELELMMEELRRKQDELAHKREDFRHQLERYSKQGFGVAAGLRRDQSSSISSSGSKAEANEDQSSCKQLTLEKLEAGINKSHIEISALSASIEKVLLAADSADSGIVKDPAKITLGPAQVPISTRFSQRGVKGSLVGTDVSFAGASQSSPMRYKLDNRTTAFHVLPPFPDGLVDVPTFTEHFSCFGDLSNVEVDDVNEGVKVTFYTRSAAEKAFLQGRCYQGTYLCFSWVKQSSSITPGASSVDTVAADTSGKNTSHYCSKVVVGLRLKEVNIPKSQGVLGGDGSRVDESIVTKVDGELPEPDHNESGIYPSVKINPTLDSVDAGSMSGLCREAPSF